MAAAKFSDLTPAQQQALLNGPALQPPDGLKSNFDDPPNMNAGTLAIISICFVITTIMFCIRLRARILVNVRAKQWRVEDFLTISGYGIFVAITYAMYRMTLNVGFFVHQWDLRFTDLSEYLYVIHIIANLYICIVMTIKAAIILEWIRIFVPKGVRNAFFWCCQVMLWINVLFYVSAFFVANFTCRPFRHIWDKTIDGECFNSKIYEVVSAAINLASDLVILMLPQRVIWHLQMSKPKKAGVSVIFAIGVLAVVSGALRLYSSWGYYGSKDATYWSSSLVLWSLAEMTCIFIVLCVPAAPKFWNDSRILLTIHETIRSWTGLSTRGSARSASSNKAESSGPPASHKTSSNNMRHRKLADARGTALVSVPLNSLQKAGSAERMSDDEPLTGRIVCTKEITRTSEQTSPQAAAMDTYKMVNPWTDKPH